MVIKWGGHEIPVDDRGCGYLSAAGFELHFYPLDIGGAHIVRAHLGLADTEIARADGTDAPAALDAARVKLLAWLESVDSGRKALLGEAA